MTYQPGDTANGYVLGEDYQWHPLPPEAPAAPPPVQPTTALPQSYAAGPGAPPPYVPAQPQSYQPGPSQPYQQPGPSQPYPPYQGTAAPSGAPTPRRPFYKAWWFWLTVVLVVIGLVVVLALSVLRSIGNAITTITSPTNISTPKVPVPPRAPVTPVTPVTPKEPGSAPTPATPPPAGSPASGPTAQDGDLRFTVTGVDCTKKTIGKAPLAKTAKGTFCLVSVTIANSGSASADINPFLQIAVDSSGETYYPDLAAMIFMDDAESFIDPIPAGASATGVFPFDVPSGTTLASVELHETFSSSGAKITVP